MHTDALSAWVEFAQVIQGHQYNFYRPLEGVRLGSVDFEEAVRMPVEEYQQ
jgi:hypothetical protein